MFTRILTEYERTKLHAFLETGERPENLRQTLRRIRLHLPQIKGDIALMEKALKKHEKNTQERLSSRPKKKYAKAGPHS
jgi:hypothetical protein